MSWVGQLRGLLLSREGGGTLLMAVATAVALGVVPTILEQWTQRHWVFLAVFAVSIALVLAGWVLRRPRGLGVVVCLFPAGRTQGSRVAVLKVASRSAHSGTLVIDRGALWPDEPSGQDSPGMVDLVARLVDAQVEELRHTSQAEAAVVLYPLAQLQDGFLLGRRLADDAQLSLAVMHLSQRSGRSVVPGVTLDSGLREDLPPQQRARVQAHLRVPASGSPDLVEVPSRAGQQRHRIAVIVRLASADSMVDDARHIAVTGQVTYPAGHHTGYLLETEQAGPFGAYVVIDTGNAYLPETPELFAAVTTYIWQSWRNARQEWAQHLGDDFPVEGALFFHGPLPIAIALGWLTARDRLDLVHHDTRLSQPAPTPPAAGR
ncbi:hypothetical protein [Actinacidiphila glaucinigra]|uniref:hypothetical protein n=1 Tax=Actinacidiphila glaucinigra TaxID=235986 RepID=UPI00366BDD68